MPSVSQRKTYSGRGSIRCRHTWNDGEGNPGFSKIRAFFPPSGKCQWISAFQTDYSLTILCELHQQFVRLNLQLIILTGAFAGVDLFDFVWQTADQLEGDQIIINNYICIIEQRSAQNRYQPRMTGTSAHKMDDTFPGSRVTGSI